DALGLLHCLLRGQEVPQQAKNGVHSDLLLLPVRVTWACNMHACDKRRGTNRLPAVSSDRAEAPSLCDSHPATTAGARENRESEPDGAGYEPSGVIAA